MSWRCGTNAPYCFTNNGTEDTSQKWIYHAVPPQTAAPLRCHCLPSPNCVRIILCRAMIPVHWTAVIVCVTDSLPAGWHCATPLPYSVILLLHGVIFDVAAVLCCGGRTNHHIPCIKVGKVVSMCYHSMPFPRCHYNATLWQYYDISAILPMYRIDTYGTVIHCHGMGLQCHGTILDFHGTVLDFHGPVLDCHGTVLNFHGTVLDLHGAVLHIHGPVRYIDGTVIQRNSMVVHGHSNILTTLAMIMHTDGTVVHCYGCLMDLHGMLHFYSRHGTALHCLLDRKSVV